MMIMIGALMLKQCCGLHGRCWSVRVLRAPVPGSARCQWQQVAAQRERHAVGLGGLRHRYEACSGAQLPPSA